MRVPSERHEQHQPGVAPDRELLVELANARMPFGKYTGRRLLELPEPYLAWMARHGFPRGRLGLLLENAHVVRSNGLEGLLRGLVRG